MVLKHVIRDGLFLTPQEFAVKCNIKVINARKLFLTETRKGPANHVSNNNAIHNVTRSRKGFHSPIFQ